MNVVIPLCFILRFLIYIYFSQHNYNIKMSALFIATRRSHHQTMFITTYVYKWTVNILGSQKGLQCCHIKFYLYIPMYNTSNLLYIDNTLYDNPIFYMYLYIILVLLTVLCTDNTLYVKPVRLFGIPKCAQLPFTHVVLNIAWWWIPRIETCRYKHSWILIL